TIAGQLRRRRHSFATGRGEFAIGCKRLREKGRSRRIYLSPSPLEPRVQRRLRGWAGVGCFRRSLRQFGALLGWLFGVAQVASRVDQRDVRKGLWKISELTPRARVI